MDANTYVKSIVDKYTLVGRSASATTAAEALYKIIQPWAGSNLLNVQYSGSNAKGTAISGAADVDLFISLKPETPGTLADIYNSLANYGGLKNYAPRRQNVSIGVKYGTHSIDLVPGRKQPGNTSDHSLYRSKAGTWTKTNVEKHVSIIQNCNRLDEIRAIKIWRALHGLEFPSFYLELTVINALNGKRTGDLAANTLTVLQYLMDKLLTAVVIDPVNSNNILSDDLTIAEKKIIVQRAISSCNESNWGQILW